MGTYEVPEFIQVGGSRVYVDRGGSVPENVDDRRGHLPPGASQATSVAEAIQQYQLAAQLVLAEVQTKPSIVVVCPNIWSHLTSLLNVR